MIAGQLRHADRIGRPSGYCAGLMLEGQRKSVDLMAARVPPSELRLAHQCFYYFVADALWSEAAVFGAARERVLAVVVKRAESPEVLIITDTGLSKRGKHSVGVAR